MSENGDRQPTAEEQQPTAEDRAELELRDRVTVLEHWRGHVDEAIVFLALAGLVLAGGTLALLVLLRRERKP
jgi:hypothetical protein